jgi:diguanylate cyclase (GGDEF)-like protein
MKTLRFTQRLRGRPFLKLLSLALALTAFLLIFYWLRPVFGTQIGSLSIIPVILAAWYFGPTGGVFMTLLCLLSSTLISNTQGVPFHDVFLETAFWLGGSTLAIVGFVFGKLGALNTSYKQALFDQKVSDEELRLQAEFLSLLNDLTRTALEAGDVQSLLTVLVRRIAELFPGAETYLALWDADRALPVIVATLGGEEKLTDFSFVPTDPTMTAAALETRHAIVVEDASNSPYFNPEVAARFESRSALGLPLIAGTQKIGSIIVSYKEKHLFTGGEIERGELAAQQIALALTKTRLLEEAHQRVDELTGLHEIAKTFRVSSHISQTYKLLSKKLARLTGARICFILLCDAEQKRIFAQSPGFGVGASTLAELHFPAASLDVFCSLADQDIFLTNLLEEIPDILKSIPGNRKIKSVLAAPLRVDGRLIGLILLANKPAGFEDEDARLMRSFATQAAVVIQSSQMLDITQKQANRQAALMQISTELSTTLDETDIFQRVVEGLEKHLGFEHVGIFTVDEAAGERVLRAGSSWPRPVRLPSGQGLSERPLLDGKLHYSPDVNTEPRYYSSINGSEVDVPIWLDGKVMGVLSVESPRLDAFQPADFEVLSSAANLTGLALARTRSVEAERRQYGELHVLHQVALAATQATTEDELIEQATKIIGENLYPDNFGILLLDQESLILRPHYSYHLSGTLEIIEVPLGKGVSGQVAANGNPQRIDDIENLTNYLDVDPKTRSELCVPLMVGGEMLGVINAERTQVAAFSEDDERLLTTLASQLATTLVRLRSVETQQRWFARMVRSNELISALAHVAALIEKAYEPEEVMRLLGQELKRLYMECMIALYQPEKQELSVRYTTFDNKLLQSFRQYSGVTLQDLRVDAGIINSFVDLLDQPKPTVLDDLAGLLKATLDHLPEGAIADLLKALEFSPDTLIIHLPLLFEGRLLGMLWLWGENLSEQDIQAMSVFANQVAVALENARLFAEVRRLAITDDLTRLYNRRHTYELARIEFNRARRYKRSISAIMIDIDHFKRVNDQFGHPGGDEVLRFTAEKMRLCLRDADILGRYGGEEFLIVLPETDSAGAIAVAERIRETIAGASIPTEKGEAAITLSLGVAAYNETTHDLETLIARADQALYVSKYKGRNRSSVGN